MTAQIPVKAVKSGATVTALAEFAAGDTIDPTYVPAQVNADWTAVSGVAQILNKPTLGTAAAQDVGAFATAAQGVKADAAIPSTQAGAANGIATLDAGGKLDAGQLPALAITETFVVADQAAMLALACQQGDVAVRTDLSQSFILTATPPSTLANWQQLLTPTSPVTSVFGRTGSVTAGSGDYTFAQLAGTPTTLVGYGITDAAPLTGSGTSGTWGISINGNAATATKLATARTINGVSFDGSANIVAALPPPVNAQTGTAYTLALTDAPVNNASQGIVTMNNAAANTLTVPPNSSVAFPVGTIIQVVQLGAGQTAVAAGAGVTINNPSSLTARVRYSTLLLTQVAANVWVLSGDLT